MEDPQDGSRSFEDRFHISDKQRKTLDKWPIGSGGEDVTTEEESFYSGCFDLPATRLRDHIYGIKNWRLELLARAG